MGQSVVIATPWTWDLMSFAPLLEAIARDESARFVVRENALQVIETNYQWHIVLDAVSDQAAWAEEFSTNDLLDPRFLREAAGLRYFNATFQNFDVMKTFLRAIARTAIAQKDSVWFDTDYGWVIDAQELWNETERAASWDWRREQPQIARPPT